MKKLLLILLFIPLLGKSQSLHKIFKYSTVYAAINGGTSLGDNQIFSITSGALEEDIIKTLILMPRQSVELMALSIYLRLTL